MPFKIDKSIKTPCLLNAGHVKFSFRFKSKSYSELLDFDSVLALMHKCRNKTYYVGMFVMTDFGCYVFHRSILHEPTKEVQLTCFSE